MAVKIKEELEKKMGYNISEPEIDISDGFARGRFFKSNPDKNYTLWVVFARYYGGLELTRQIYNSQKSYYGGNGFYGIENENVLFFIYAEKKEKNTPFQEVPEEIKIAEEVIEKNGYGKCKKI